MKTKEEKINGRIKKMSGGKRCKCENPKWEVLQYKCNYSAFEYPKGQWHSSDYSLLHCKNCDAFWRTKADYVEKVMREQENDE